MSHDCGTQYRRVRTVVGGFTQHFVIGMALLALAALAVAEIRQSASEQQIECHSRLKQLALGIMMYVQDYDEIFPPMQYPAQVQHRVLPYVKTRQVFICPASGKDYLPNPALNYVALGDIAKPATTMMLRDPLPHKTDAGESTWNLAYADGHVATSATEPPLGKLAPPATRAVKLRRLEEQLKSLKQNRRTVDEQIRAVEAAIRSLQRHH